MNGRIGRRGSTRGLTLLEVVMMATVLIVLVGMAVPRSGLEAEGPRVRAAKAQIEGLQASLQRLREDVGAFPADVAGGIDPGLLDAGQVPDGRRKDWRGPYGAGWPARHPWGGELDYEAWSFPGFDADGIPGNEVLISLRGRFEPTALDALDAALDDGRAATGDVRHDGARWLGVKVGEGASW